jgi:hypothetical protein
MYLEELEKIDKNLPKCRQTRQGPQHEEPDPEAQGFDRETAGKKASRAIAELYPYNFADKPTYRTYCWTGRKSSSGFSDRPPAALGVFASLDRF